MEEFVPGVSKIGHYLFEKQLGSGAFATVWLARHLVLNVQVAVKVISKSSLNDEDSVIRFEREVKILKSMDHDLIAEFFEHIEDDVNHYLVMEFAAKGTLLDFVNNNEGLSEIKARKYFAQLISVLSYLHNVWHIAHRDLKPENVLLDRYDNIRIIDFGLSKNYNADDPNLSTQCGSPAYAPPEMIKGEPYTNAADIWSAGVLLFSIVTLELPFDGVNAPAMMKKIVFSQPVFPSQMSPLLVDLLSGMLKKNPDNRITLEEIQNHKWFLQKEFENFNPSKYAGPSSPKKIVEKDIVQTLSTKGVDVKQLQQDMNSGKFSGASSMYRILLKEKRIELLKHLSPSKTN